VWSYTASSAHDEFVAGTTYSETFQVTSADSTPTSVTVNILGTNDAAIVSGLTITESLISFVATDPDSGTLALTSPFAAPFANPTIASGATTNLTPASQAASVSGTLQVSDGSATADVIGLYLGTGSDDSFTAGSSSTAIYGFGGSDILTGGTAADFIFGGTGADTVAAGAGNDTINLANGDFVSGESIDGRANSDTIVLTNGTTVDFTLGTVMNIENLTGSTGDDIVTFSALQLAGLGAVDLVSGTDTLNVVANGDISQLALAMMSNIDTGNLIGTTGNDSITLAGAQLNAILTGSGAINLGSGTGDTINLTSTSSDLNTLGATNASIQGVEAISAATAGAGVTITLSDQTEAFSISGSANVDTITGGAGADTIAAGGGNDILTGGTGSDQFVFNTALDAATNIDQITDFDVVADTIVLDQAIFTAIVGTGTLTVAQFASIAAGTVLDASDRIVYENDTGKLFYDSNGNAVGGATQFAQLATGLALTNNDFLIV
jgi:Ca2+-binding RTX toxin-like protein